MIKKSFGVIRFAHPWVFESVEFVAERIKPTNTKSAAIKNEVTPRTEPENQSEIVCKLVFGKNTNAQTDRQPKQGNVGDKLTMRKILSGVAKTFFFKKSIKHIQVRGESKKRAAQKQLIDLNCVELRFCQPQKYFCDQITGSNVAWWKHR